MEEKKEFIKKDKNIIFILTGIAIVVIIILALRYFNNPVTKFKRNLDNVDASKLAEIYSSTQSYDEKKKIEKVFENKLKEITDSFENGSKNYEDAIEEIDRYKDIKGLENSSKSAKENIEKIRTSKDNFSEAKKFEEDGNIFEAIKSYLKVDALDKSNYSEAQNYIKNNKV